VLMAAVACAALPAPPVLEATAAVNGWWQPAKATPANPPGFVGNLNHVTQHEVLVQLMTEAPPLPTLNTRYPMPAARCTGRSVPSCTLCESLTYQASPFACGNGMQPGRCLRSEGQHGTMQWQLLLQVD
jgi:hypothetical protein